MLNVTKSSKVDEKRSICEAFHSSNHACSSFSLFHLLCQHWTTYQLAAVTFNAGIKTRRQATMADLEYQRSSRGRQLPSTWQQCGTIVYHTWLLKMANKTSTVLELLFPIFTISIALLYPYFIPKDESPLTPTFSNLTTANYSNVYTFNPVPVTSASNSYLARGSFVPMSQLLIAPKSDTTIKLGKNVFMCVLGLAGYSVSLKQTFIKL